ncbi:FAD-binding oxidoreductase [Levilactobacillus fujinensis]|uniref:FAD-binding oxidoreductase n=1 Tax=Levilactobacillus fujinensis TaxID=2486024 RepID=A0ABW1TDU4_9LACO|nr:FAD-binding oxidoreductase [Levilactobacillus fujinensis]
MLKRVPYVQGIVWLMVLFVVPLPLIQALALGLPATYASESLAIQWGSIAYVWFLAAIYLSTRPKWLDRLIGLPSVYFIHGILSIFAISLAYLHKTGTQSFGLIKQTGDWSFDLFMGLAIYSLVFMAGWLTNRSRLLRQVKRQLERIFHHEFSVWLHRLNLVAVLLVFIHVQLISYITAITAYIWLFNGYTAVVMGLYLWQKYRQIWRLPRARLVATRRLTTNFVELTFQLRHPQQLKVAAGDYVFLKFPEIAGLRELHPFSVVNAVDDSGIVVLAIRGDGDFTRQVQTVSVGSQARLMGGYGRFMTVLQEHPHDRLVLIGGGSGIVPLLAIIAAKPAVNVDLYYTAHTVGQLIYAQELRRRASTQSQLSLHVQASRFDVTQTVAGLNSTATIYLISGPAVMGRTWQRALTQHGVAAKDMYYEEFNW